VRSFVFSSLGPYLCWKRTRRPRLVIVLSVRRAEWPLLSGRATLAAANSRSRCVLVDGCPVLRVHFALGLAPHMGQRTDKICPNVSFSGFASLLFDIANLSGQSCLRDFNDSKTRTLIWNRSLPMST
jgi:hypothetical protein